jgi:hypothetical protein
MMIGKVLRLLSLPFLPFSPPQSDENNVWSNPFGLVLAVIQRETFIFLMHSSKITVIRLTCREPLHPA